MSNAVELANCDVCNKTDVPIIRTYYRYDVDCGCHSPYHFEIVRHCKGCKPTEPILTNILLSRHNKQGSFTINLPTSMLPKVIKDRNNPKSKLKSHE